MAPGFKDSQNSSLPCPPQTPPAPTIWSQPGTSLIPSCALFPLAWRDLWLPGLHCLASQTWFCCGTWAPSLPPSASWLPEGHLTSARINGLSASVANSLISHKTVWNSVPTTVLGKGVSFMGKFSGPGARISCPSSQALGLQPTSSYLHPHRCSSL